MGFLADRLSRQCWLVCVSIELDLQFCRRDEQFRLVAGVLRCLSGVGGGLSFPVLGSVFSHQR